MTDTKLEVKVPEGVVESVIHAEILKAIPNKEKMMAEIIHRMLTAKECSWDKETVFEKTVKQMIEEKAKNIFSDWIRKHEEDITKALMKYLNSNRQKRLKDFCEELIRGVTKYRIEVRLNLGEQK